MLIPAWPSKTTRMPVVQLRMANHSTSLTAVVITILFGTLQKLTLALVDLLDQQREAAFRAGAFNRQIPQGELTLRILITGVEELAEA